jgi:hypothetical protein
MSDNKVLNFLEGYKNIINVKRDGSVYQLNLKKNNRIVSHLDFQLFRNGDDVLYMKIISGDTPRENNRGLGYGTLLRALATKAGQIAGAKRGLQNGLNIGNRSLKRLKKNTSAKPVPTSSFIMSERLGWKESNNPEFWRNGLASRFNYNKNNFSKVNNIVKNHKAFLQLMSNMRKLRAVPSSGS